MNYRLRHNGMIPVSSTHPFHNIFIVIVLLFQWHGAGKRLVHAGPSEADARSLMESGARLMFARSWRAERLMESEAKLMLAR
jgi:hypothetical protein